MIMPEITAWVRSAANGNRAAAIMPTTLAATIPGLRPTRSTVATARSEPPTEPTDNNAANASDDDTVSPCFTKKLGSQPFRIHTTVWTVMFSSTVSADKRNTDLVNKILAETAGGCDGLAVPTGAQA